MQINGFKVKIIQVMDNMTYYDDDGHQTLVLVRKDRLSQVVPQ